MSSNQRCEEVDSMGRTKKQQAEELAFLLLNGVYEDWQTEKILKRIEELDK